MNLERSIYWDLAKKNATYVVMDQNNRMVGEIVVQIVTWKDRLFRWTVSLSLVGILACLILDGVSQWIL